MTRELTDEEVFGTPAQTEVTVTAPRELSDAEVFGTPAAPRESVGDALLRAPGRAARMAVQGAPQVVDMFANAAAALGNVVPAVVNDVAGRTVIPEPFRYNVLTDAARGVADAAGLPQYQDSAAGRVIGTVGEAVSGAGPAQVIGRATAPLVRGGAQMIARAFGDAPGVDAIASAAGGAAQGVANEAGVGQVGQTGAALGGGLVGSVVASAIIAAVARGRGVSPASVRVESITPEERASALADPDVQRVAAANGITDPADPRLVVLQPRIEAARAAEAERGAVAPSVTAEDLRAARTAVEDGVDPAAVAPPARQPVPETIALPDQSGAIPRVRTADGARVPEPPLRGTADPNAVPMDPARLRSEDAAAAEAFALADAQRQRMTAPDTRDTQVAGVRTADGAPVADSARMGQDFVARSGSPRDPELPRMPEDLAVQTGPRQTYRFTGQDPNAEFPGAERGTGPEGGRGRTPLPEQPSTMGPAPSPRPPQGPPTPAIDGAPGRGASPEVARIEQQIGRLTARGEPALGTPAARQVARLREELRRIEGVAERPALPAPESTTPAGEPRRALPAPQPDGPVRPPEAETTTRQAAPGVETPRVTLTESSAPPTAGRETGGRFNAVALTVDRTDASAAPISRSDRVAEPSRPVRALKAPEDIERVSAARLKTLYDRAFDETSALTKAMIDAGRGSEKPAQTRARAADGDPLAQRWAEANDRFYAVVEEQRRRRAYGGSDKPIPLSPEEKARRAAAREPAARQSIQAEDETGRKGTVRPGPGGTLSFYANPLADPEAWRRFLIDPIAGTARALRDRLMSGVASIGTTPGAGAAWRLYADSARATLMHFRDRYSSVPGIREMTEALGATDPGSGTVSRGGYQETADATVRSLQNRLSNMLRPLGDDAASLGRVRDILTGGNARGATTAERDAARRVRDLLNEHHAWLTKRLGSVEREMGYVRNRYFPRRFDAEAIQGDLAGFQADATALYRRMGLDADTAKAAAEEWSNRVMGIGAGAARYADTPASSYTKGRTLPPETDTLMRRWLVTDPREALASYVDSSTRHAEFVSRFGPGGQKFDEVLAGMRQAGATATEIDIMRRTFAAVTGTAAGAGSPTTGLMSWTQMWGMRQLLTRALFSSAAEPLAVGMRSGNLGDGFRALGDTWRRFLTPDSWQGDTARMETERAQMLGIIGDAGREMLMAARVEGQNLRHRDAARINQMLTITGQNRLFEASRVAASRIAEHTVGRLLADAVDSTSSTRGSAQRGLAEVGMDAETARTVRDWLNRHGGRPPIAELTGDTPAANAYRTAVNRFVNEAVLNPMAIDKPTGAGERHPLSQLAYGIMSFQYAFTRNVLIRTFKQGGEALTEGGMTGADRLALLAPVAGMAVLAAAQYGMSNVRDAVFNRQAARERPPIVDTVLALDRAGLFGNLSPLVNLVTSAKYERDASGSMIGPYLGNMLRQAGDMTLGLVPQEAGGPNSPNTNNAEWSATRAAWSLIAAPAMVGVLASAPVPAWLKPAAGAGAMYVGSSDMSRSVATAVAGERTVQARTPGGARGGSGGLGAGGGLSSGGGLRSGSGLSSGGGLSR